jgi:beta-lactamase class A
MPDTEESRPYGLGMTIPAELATLVEMLAEGRVGGAAVSAEILAILGGQMLRDTIPRALPEEWKYAGKTGGIDGVRNDVALVTAPDGSQAALALFAQELFDQRWSPDNAGLLALARVAKRVLEL